MLPAERCSALLLCLRRLVSSPEPSQGIGQQGRAVFRCVGAIPKLEAVVVVHELERRSHLLVGQWPVAVLVVQVARAVLQEDPDRFWFRLADDSRIDVPTADVCEAANGAEHLSKLVGTLPGDRERADASTA